MNEPSFLLTESAPQPRRIPNLGHAAIFLLLYALISAGLALGLTALNGHPSQILHGASKFTPAFQRIALGVSIGSALLTFLCAWPIFTLIWDRPFLSGLRWNSSQASAHLGRLIGTGFGLSILAQLIERLLTVPDKVPMDAFFHSRSTIWLLTVYGVIIAPVFEETLFRGFLLPSVAAFLDWMRRRPLHEDEIWADGLSRRALAFSAVLTSIAFGAVHATQLGYAWNVVAVLSCVGLTLAWVRLHYDSVAASALVHASYNGLLFFALFVGSGGYRHLDQLSSR